jgi:hypothetical protein
MFFQRILPDIDTDTSWTYRAAELLDALPDDDLDPELTFFTQIFSPQTDPVELRLEHNELPKYLMAKAFFDCHEPQRCAAVFLPISSSEHIILMWNGPLNNTHGKVPTSIFKEISQRGLFLASYALLMAGEKEKMEELKASSRAVRYWRYCQQTVGTSQVQLAIGNVYVDSVILQSLHDYPRWKQENALLYYKPLGFEGQ